jgi:hypothetical protein
MITSKEKLELKLELSGLLRSKQETSIGFLKFACTCLCLTALIPTGIYYWIFIAIGVILWLSVAFYDYNCRSVHAKKLLILQNASDSFEIDYLRALLAIPSRPRKNKVKLDEAHQN